MAVIGGAAEMVKSAKKEQTQEEARPAVMQEDFHFAGIPSSGCSPAINSSRGTE
jgi:hypothetical protein